MTMRGAPVAGVQIPRILLPRPDVELHKWAVIACDQFTSEPEYWQEVAELVGDAPSTYHITLPEVYLGTRGEAGRVEMIRRTMEDYLACDLFDEHEGLVLVERTAGGRTRHGLMLALDLEQYDFSRGAASLIRATEGTILERIPPRVRIRLGAPLELPHVLVLIDDPGRTVIEPLVAARHSLTGLYDFELMLGSGHLRGYCVEDKRLQGEALAALQTLSDPLTFGRKYGVEPGTPVLSFAVGDGNHSLATAKTIWEGLKAQVGPDHPARYALVEVENIHDEGLAFESILRVLFDVGGDFVAALNAFYKGRCRWAAYAHPDEMIARVEGQDGPEHAIGIITPGGCSVVYVADPPANLPVGTIQGFLDAWGKSGGFARIDYVHGKEVALRLGSQPGNLGIYLPAISKSALFRTVIVDGALPRKTFSMGEAKEKRFYMEARRIA
jgi:Protein of unknown function (DUF1015)